jgi:hypothetical protein
LPEAGYTFANWTAGPCSGANTNPCNTGAISAAITATALFNEATTDSGGMRVTATANGLPAALTTNDAFISNPVTVRYNLRSCTELFVIVNGPGISWSYLNSTGALVPITSLTGITPHRGSGPGDGLYTLVANYTAISGNYDLYFACDNTLNNRLDTTPTNMVFDYVRVIVPAAFLPEREIAIIRAARVAALFISSGIERKPGGAVESCDPNVLILPPGGG